jgi:hypothetical protein
MSFRVQKSLGNSFFQFAVGRRREFTSIDADRELSTGPSGEFIRHRPEIFYSADLLSIRTPEMPVHRSISSTPFWGSLVDGTQRGWIFLGMMILGALFLLWGLALVPKEGRQEIVLFILGIVLIGIPFAMTTQKRLQVRQHEERIRRERHERDERDRELLAAYTSSLERLREDPSDVNLATVRRENEKLDLPYAVWADTAIGTVLYVGFSTLAKVGPDRASEVAALMDRASDAAGLIAEDSRAVKHALYSTILWHFIADDRLGQEQLKIVRAIQQGFGITNEDIPLDAAAEAQFERLRGIDHRNAPRCDAEMALGMNEYCMLLAQIESSELGTTPMYVTNRRILVGADKKLEIPVPQIDDVTVDADANRITLRAAELKRPLDFTSNDPLYLAAIIDLATRLDDRPKSFA